MRELKYPVLSASHLGKSDKIVLSWPVGMAEDVA